MNDRITSCCAMLKLTAAVVGVWLPIAGYVEFRSTASFKTLLGSFVAAWVVVQLSIWMQLVLQLLNRRNDSA